MAETIQIQGTSETAKIRNPLGVVGLAIITLGIYAIFWYYFANKELAAIGKSRNTDECGTSPGTSVLAVTLGALVIVPALISAYNFGKRLNAAERHTGTPEGMEPGLLLLLYIFLAPIAAYIAQSNLNKVLTQQGSGGAAPATPEAPPAPERPAEPPTAQPPATPPESPQA